VFVSETEHSVTCTVLNMTWEILNFMVFFPSCLHTRNYYTKLMSDNKSSPFVQPDITLFVKAKNIAVASKYIWRWLLRLGSLVCR